MTAILAMLGLTLLLLPGVARLPVARIHPAEWTRVGAFALRLGHRSLQLALLLGAAPTVLHALGVEHAAMACHEMFGPVAPGGPLVGWSAAVLLSWTLVGDHRARRNLRNGFDRVRVDPWLGTHEYVDDVDVVTLPTDVPLAYAVPTAAGGQIVLSSALVADLDSDELAGVVAHERSHLRHGHHRHLQLLASIDMIYRRLPGIAASTARLRLALERWADEDAARTPEQRQNVRSALTKTTQLLLAPTMAFTGCTVIDRIEALGTPTPTPSYPARALALGPIAVATGFLAVVATTWFTLTHHGIAGILGFCTA